MIVAYLRVSGVAQIDGDGFDRQLIACQNYAAQHNLTIARTFEERGVSGTKDLDNRPALQELLLALDGKDNCTILIERLDRLARDLMIQETILADLLKRGHTLISVSEPDLCRDDPSRKMMRQIFGAIAEYDRTMIVLKLRGARQRVKAKTGRCEGRYPFGRDPKLPMEAPVLREIMDRRRAGQTAEYIADKLNEQGLPARHSASWRRTTIAKIIRREGFDKSQDITCALEAA